MVARSFFWEDAPTQLFKEFIEANKRDGYSGSASVSKRPEDENGMPIEYQEYVADLFENALNYPVKEWRFWIGVTMPDKANTNVPTFAKGFPHAHGWEALTAVHYVQEPDYGGALLVVDAEHNPIHRFEAKVGMTAVVDGWSMHGVELVGGVTPRYTLIATGFAAKGK